VCETSGTRTFILIIVLGFKMELSSGARTVARDGKTNTIQLQPGFDMDKDGSVNIDDELKPKLLATFENSTSFNVSILSAKCLTLTGSVHISP
jgi:hypothetical protein